MNSRRLPKNLHEFILSLSPNFEFEGIELSRRRSPLRLQQPAHRRCRESLPPRLPPHQLHLRPRDHHRRHRQLRRQRLRLHPRRQPGRQRPRRRLPRRQRHSREARHKIRQGLHGPGHRPPRRQQHPPSCHARLHPRPEMVYSTVDTESKAHRADTLSNHELTSVERLSGVDVFSSARIEMPPEIIAAVDEFSGAAAAVAEEKKASADEEEEAEPEAFEDPFAASDKLN